MGLARAELSNIDQVGALVLARRLLGAHPAPAGLSRWQRRSYRHPHPRTREETREARVDALGRDLRGGETDACSATPAGEAETPAQSGSGCRSGFCLWGGLSEDQLRCSRVPIPGGAALHCWGGHSTEYRFLRRSFLGRLGQNQPFLQWSSSANSQPDEDRFLMDLATNINAGTDWPARPRRGTEGSFALQGMSCLQQGLSARQQALLPQSAPQLAAA